MRVGFDTSPLVQTRAGTARHVRGLLGALAGREGLELTRLSFGGPGRGPSQFRMPHMLCVDSKGAIYVAEVDGRRVQKFVPQRD